MAQTESLSVTVGAPAADVLAFLRDIDNQKNWFPGNLESEVLERDADGRPTRARLVNDVKVAKDEFQLDYTHADDGFSWVLVKPTSVQKSQVGSWQVVAVGDDQSEVTMTLTVDTSLPLPGFVQKRIIKDTLKGATAGLAKQF
jgi:ribosome-associated toxin RatA of RatAB toxin-antitoxin module